MNKQIKEIVKLSVVAAIYVALTMAFKPISYGTIQFRVAEVLMLLVCYDKKYTISLVIGCLISNIISIYTIDIVFGTLATLLSCITMFAFKKRKFAGIMPVIFNGIIVGAEHYFMSSNPFYYIFLYILSISVSEFLVICVLGNLLFNYFEKNEMMMNIIKGKTRK